MEVSKIKNKCVLSENELFENSNIDFDDRIYQFRKKFNFGIFNLSKLRTYKRKKEAKKNTFNSLVDETYIINLERRKDRAEHMSAEMKRLDVSYKFFNAVDGQKLKEKTVASKAVVATVRSHIGVVKDAIEKGYEKIAVFEDDIIFCDDFDSRLRYYLDNIPSNWDIMYLGCHFNACVEPTIVKNNVYKVHECYGCFSMILNNQNGLFQKIIDSVTELLPYDNYIKSLQKNLNCYVFKPFFVKSMITTTDIGDRKDSFSYDVVNKHYASVFYPEVVKAVVPEPPRPRIENVQPVRSNQYMCEDYLRSNAPFVIYFNNRIIFDSTSTDKSNIKFEQNYFTLYGKIFPYQGMMIKRK
jgi:GR25 family glycosyltransferase involved in LPS biosynthesis